jgi:YidC/Oxa1 family membrane protein insertase
MFKNLDKNTIIGIALIALMVGLYVRNVSTKAKEYEKSKAISKEIADTTSIQNEKIITPNLDSIKKSNEVAVDTNTVKNQVVTIGNKLVSFEINTLGGGFTNASIKNYTTFEEQPVKMLPKEKTQMFLKIPTASGVLSTKNIDFTPVSVSDTKVVLKSQNGIEIIYELDSNNYMLKQSWTIPGLDKSKNIEMEFVTEMLQQEANLERERQYSTIKYLTNSGSYTTNLNPAKNTEETSTESFKYISFGQQFFNTTIIPSVSFSKGTFSTFYLENELDYVKKYKASLSIPSSENLTFKYFVGPTSYSLLKEEKIDLEEIVPLSQDFVIFRWVKIFNEYLIIPLFDFLSQFFTNYGIIIFLLTLIIKTVLLPLSYKTYKSGVAMRVLKPELDKLRAKHGDDQQAFAQEQMKIFSEYGVSPFGGCLPMLLQMPILVAMFSFFPAAIELRHQAFLWAPDLSTFDSIINLPFKIPFYGAHVSLFALLMTVTQIGTSWYMQKLQPSSPQADQMKLMIYIMPIFMLFLFNSFPAAITYYYLLQNIISIVQQWAVTKIFISEDKIREEIDAHKKKPKKQSLFQKKMQEAMQLAEEQKKMQQNRKK